jgi:hypothetical protein
MKACAATHPHNKPQGGINERIYTFIDFSQFIIFVLKPLQPQERKL